MSLMMEYYILYYLCSSFVYFYCHQLHFSGTFFMGFCCKCIYIHTPMNDCVPVSVEWIHHSNVLISLSCFVARFHSVKQ